MQSKLHLAFYIGDKTNPSATFMDRLVCFVTKSKFSHVELVLDKETGYSVSSSPRDGGVRYAYIDYSKNHWVLVPITVETHNPKMIVEWFNSFVGMKYDYIGAVGSVLPFNIENQYRWFSSEILTEFLRWSALTNESFVAALS